MTSLSEHPEDNTLSHPSTADPLPIMLNTRYPLDGVLTMNVTRTILSEFRPTCDHVEDGITCDGASFGYKESVPAAQGWFHTNADSHRLRHIRDLSEHRQYLQDRFVYYAITLISLCPDHLKEAKVPGWSDGYTDIKTEPCGMVTGQYRHTPGCQILVRSDGEGGPISLDGKRRCSEIHAMRSNIRQLWGLAYGKGTKRSAICDQRAPKRRIKERDLSPAAATTDDGTVQGSSEETKSDFGGRIRSSSVSEGTSSAKIYQYAIDLANELQIIITSDMTPISAGYESISGTSFAVRKGKEVLLDYETRQPTDISFGLRQLRRLFLQSQNMATRMTQQLTEVFREYDFEEEILNDW